MTAISVERDSRRVETAPPRRADSVVPRLLRVAWQLVAMACLALALITGIVAMHSLVSPTSHSDMGMSAAMSTGSSTAEHSTMIASVVSSPDCVGCGDDASMVLMWCVLALLTVSLLLAAPRLVRGWGQYVEQRLMVAVPFPRWARVVPPRPNLITLCISRT
ncbi:DUF6153 family protein [Salinibacterium sp. PAMC 21357]|uniref:DUF6153 family protein n=1 Tax=Salinibacterium sp. PAMC 21357 TaxID=1112215 RepID=UPI000289DBBB|nr:DUF6153 family protein [Salinibacterium sp. PAMC 21357]